MRFLTTACLILTFATAGSFAPAAEPSDASIEELMRLSKIDRLMEQVTAQVDAATEQVLQGTRPQGSLTPAQEQTLATMRQHIREAQHEFLNGDKFRPMMARVYKQSFTQEELDGIIDFYRTPAGQAMINKMPLVMQNSMREMQGAMKAYMDKLRQIQQDTSREMSGESAAPGK